MSSITDQQRKWLRGAGMGIALVAVVLIVLSLLGVTNQPVYIPLLVLGAAGGIMLGTQKPST